MRIFVFRGTVFRVHPLFLCIVIVALLAGQGAFIFAAITALFLHEAGHIFVASRLRLRMAQIEITPFGGSMHIEGAQGLRPLHAFILAMAGPLVNALSIPISILIIHKSNIESRFLLCFLVSSALLLAVNLLPVLPLDGGRMLLAILSRWIRREAAFRALLIAGRVAAVSAILFSGCQALRGNYQSLPMMLGFYLLYAAALEERHGAARYLAGLISRRVKVDKNHALPVQTLCASRDMPLYMLLPQLSAGAYHRVIVVDADAARPLGTLDEADILRAALDSPTVTLQTIMKR